MLIVAATAAAEKASAQVLESLDGSTTAEPAPATGDTTAPVPSTDTEEQDATTGGDQATAKNTKQAKAKSSAKGSAARRATKLQLKLSNASPNTYILDSRKRTRFKFELAGTGTRNVVVRAINTKDGKVAKHWKFKKLPTKEVTKVRWDGKLRKGFARQGKYTFKVYPAHKPGADPVDSRKAKGKSRVNFHRNQFPIRARHTYGDGFGAGRGHKGADVFAKCGKKLRAVRGGRVQYSGYHSAAGNYVVVDGKGTKKDFVYMHLKRRGVREGKRLKTGDKIGLVGETGNAVGCHLHFEMWSGPGWYEGGDPQPPTRALKKWDRYS